MSTPPFRIEPLANQDRNTFICGVDPLDRYFRTQVSQDIRRRITACYIALERDTDKIVGFYTLSACHVAVSDLPEQTGRKLPRYPSIPAVRVGRLAVAENFKGRGLGGALLIDAAARALHSDIAAFALVVDAKDDKAAAFYRHHGFLELSTSNRTLFLSLDKIAKRLNINRN